MLRHAHGLPDARADRRADLDDGAFASGRTPTADGEGGSEHLSQGDASANFAAIQGDRFDDFGHAVAFGFGDKEGGDEADEEAAHSRHNYYFPGGDFFQHAKVGFDNAPESVLEKVDQDVKGDGTESAQDADDGGGEEQEEVFAAASFFHPGASDALGPAPKDSQAVGARLFWLRNGHNFTA